jgi:hypothetical protein
VYNTQYPGPFESCDLKCESRLGPHLMFNLRCSSVIAGSGLDRQSKIILSLSPMAQLPLFGYLGRLILRRFTITLRHTTVGRTPLDDGPARRRDLYLTTHNTHNRQTSMPSVVFEPTILARERPQTHALDRTATEIGLKLLRVSLNQLSAPLILLSSE